jgi:hypothetical protein
MKKTTILLASIVILVSIVLLTFSIIVPETVLKAEQQMLVIDPLTHQQRIYMGALEWCESRGVKTAINPKDMDGTPSYYSWQFKPSTFRYYGEKYDILPKLMSDADILVKLKDYNTQKAIVEEMVLHAREINWKQQFPDCTRKIGLPPMLKISTTTP